MSGSLRCPNCPLCGQPPLIMLVGGVQAFCGNAACRVACWNPSRTLAENMADMEAVTWEALGGLQHYDRDGRAIDIMHWAQLNDDLSYKRVARDVLADGTVVSTIWLGIDHGMPWDGAPIIFETMVFPAEPPPGSRPPAGTNELSKYWAEWEMQRYATESAALAGHDQMVAKLTEAIERLRATCEEIAPAVDLTKARADDE